MVRAHTLAGLVASFACAVGAFAQGYSFTVLDSSVSAPNAYAVAYAISGNGQVIAGGDTRYQSGEQPFIWRRVGEAWIRSQLPVPPAGSGRPQNRGRAMSLSFDGDVVGGIVGDSGVPTTPNYGYAALWMQVLSGQPLLQAISTETSTCGGVRSDGGAMVWSRRSVVNFASNQVLLWEGGASTPIAPLSIPTYPSFGSWSFFASQVISNDSSLIAFNGYPDGASARTGYVWDSGIVRQLQVRPDLPIVLVGGLERLVQAVSDDGSVILGRTGSDSTSLAVTRAVRWSRAGTLALLPCLTPTIPSLGQWTFASDLSHDGQVIVGSQFSQFPYFGARAQMQTNRAIVWVNSRPRTLESILTEQGVTLGGVVPMAITAISDNGATLVGVAGANSNPDSPLVSFVATILPPGVCDDIDFNRDGNRFDPLDIDAFLSVFSEGPCLPVGASCRDIDFNNDGSSFDPEDVDAFFRVFAEGPCEV
jgi:uncharacterized membrane protein